MPVDTISLEALQNMNQPAIEQQAAAGVGTGSLGDIRLDALHDAAFGVGARGGLIEETKLIQSVLKAHEREYDTVYDFSPLMIEGRVVPPVLAQAKDLYTQKGVDTIRIARQEWTIFAQAHFSSRPPTWREYLMIDPGALAMPPTALLPKNSNERDIWQKAVAAGWGAGVKQANDAFQINLNRLTRDYGGMVNYHVLALKKTVTLPIVAQLDMPLHSAGDRMTTDETVLRLTALPQFDTDMKKWQTLGQEDDRVEGLTRPTKSDAQSSDGAVAQPVPMPQAGLTEEH
jgi:defect-in-organelle-trafficking protein DotC